MRAVPYLQRDGIGVYVGPDRVDLVELVVFRSQVRVRRAGSEPIGPDGPRNALSRLARSLGLEGRAVHGHVAPDAATLSFVDVPAFGDADDVRVWLEGQASRAGGQGLPADAVVLGQFDSGLALDAGAPARALVVQAAHDAVDAAQDVLVQAGFQVLRLGTGTVEAATLLVAAEREGLAPGALVVTEPDAASVLMLSEGAVRDAARVEVSPAHAIDEAEALGATRDRLDVCGGGTYAALAAGADGRDVHALSVPEGIDVEQAVAFGLALEAATPALRGADLLSPEARYRAEEALATATGQRAVLWVGMVVLAALLAVQGASLAAAGLLARAEAQSALRADDAAAVVTLRREVERQRRNLSVARRSAAERTNAAGLLDRVGRALPDDVWLSTIAIDSGAVAVSGYALAGDAVGRLLFALETEPTFESVSLVRTARLDPETSPEVTRPVTAFEIAAVAR